MKLESRIDAPGAPALSSTTLAPPSDQVPYLLIEPPVGWQALDARELWRYRELFWIFALRDIKVRYKQTILGSAWALIQPLGFAVIGSLIFGRNPSLTDNVRPAFLFFLVGQLPWMLFNTGLQTSAMSLVAAQNMIKKIYFPRLVLPASAVVVSLADFLVQLASVAVVVLALPLIPHVPSYHPPIQILLLPLAAIWSFVAALAIGVPLAALNVEYRDVRYVIPFVTQFMIFAAPVFWSVQEKIPRVWQPVYGLVPAAGSIDFFRWCMLGTPAHPVMWLVALAGTLLTLFAGLAYFRRVEDGFADLV